MVAFVFFFCLFRFVYCDELCLQAPPETSVSGCAEVDRYARRGSREVLAPEAQANTATDPDVQESPTGIGIERDNLDCRLQKMSGEIRQEVKKIFKAELALV